MNANTYFEKMRDEVRRLTGIWIKVKYTEWTSQRWASYLGHARSEKPDGRTFEATSPEAFLRELFFAPIKMPYNFVPPGCESKVLGAGITDDAAEEAFHRAADGWKVPDVNIDPTGHGTTSSGPLHINENNSIGNNNNNNNNNNNSSLIDGNKEAANMNEQEGPKKRKRRGKDKGKKKGHSQKQCIKPGPPPPRAPNPLRMAVLQNQLNKLKVDADVSEEKAVGVSSRWDMTSEEWAALRSGANDNGHPGNVDTTVSSRWDITYEEWAALRSGANGNEHPGNNNTPAAAHISKGAPLSTQQEGSSIVTDDDDDDESSEPKTITTRGWDTGKPRRRIDPKKKVNSHAARSIKDSIRPKKKEKEKEKRTTPPEPKKNNRRNKLNVREEFRQKLDVFGNSWAAQLQAIVQRGNYDTDSGEGGGGYPRLATYFLVAITYAIQERATSRRRAEGNWTWAHS